MKKWVFILSPLALLSAPILWNVLMPLYYSARMVTVAAKIPYHDTAIIPGASVVSNEKPSAILLERLESSVNLYRAGKISRLLLSGDGQRKNYNEVIVMKRYAMRYKVPEENILTDTQGLRTFETMLRAKSEFNIDSAVIVTQELYMPRALMLADAAGIEAIGFCSDMGRARDTPEAYFREHFARYLALYDIFHYRSQKNSSLDSPNKGG